MLSYIKNIRSDVPENIQEPLRQINYSAISGKIIGDYLYSEYTYDGLTLPPTLTPNDAPKVIVYSYSQKRELHRYGEAENVTKFAFGSKYHVTSQGSILQSFASSSNGSINFSRPISEYQLPPSGNYSIFYSNDEKYVLWTRGNSLGIVSIDKNGILRNHATFGFPSNTDLKIAYFLHDDFLSCKKNKEVYTIVGLLNTETASTVNVYTLTNKVIELESSLLLDYYATDLSVSPDIKRVATVSKFVDLDNQIYFYRLNSKNELSYLCSQTFDYSFAAIEYGPDDYIALVAFGSNSSPLMIGKISGKNRSHFELTDMFLLGRNSFYVAWDFSRKCDDYPLLMTSASPATSSTSSISGSLLSIYLAGEVVQKGRGEPAPRFFGNTSFCVSQPRNS